MAAIQPPKWAVRFLRWYCKEDYLDEIEGDLFELYSKRAAYISPNSARLFFIWNVLRSFRLVNIKKAQLSNYWTMNLLRNYTKIYFRRFRQEISHYFVNIFGITIGITILFFVLMYVYDERNIDSYHQKKDRIYRVVNKIQEEDGMHQYLSVPGPLADALKQEFPAIEETAHLTNTGSQILAFGEKRFADREWAMATPSIFKILDFEIVSGDPMSSKNPVSMVVTEDLAQRLFGTTDAVGKVIEGTNFGNVEVIAIMKEMPRNSSYRFNNIYVLSTYENFDEGWQRFINSWSGRFAQTWVLLKEGADLSDILPFKDDFVKKYVSKEEQDLVNFYFQNITDMHLGSDEMERGGMSPRLSIPYSNREFVTVILSLGFLVMFIAALNYVNLSSVQALKRTMEASIRKINGANGRNLIGQLFYETLLTILLAYGIASVLILVLFPYFREISNKDFDLSLLYSIHLIPYHFIVIISILIISAFLPALYYSRLKRSLLILKNAFTGKGDTLRKVLVSIQYALSIFLIIGSLVIYRQLNFIHSKDLGFNNDRLIVLDINSGAARRSFKEIIAGIKNNSNVVNASTSSRVPGEWKNIPTANLSANLIDQPIEVSHYGVDHRWLETYEMKLKEGTNFTGADKTDSLSIIINSKTAEMLELDYPIGETIWVIGSRDSVRMKIIGLIENFHYESLYQKIGPVVITSWNNHIRSIDYFTIRYAQNPKETLDHIESVHATFDPETPSEINFLNDQWKRFYRAEESRATITLIASIISIIISAFGLFGLINFTVERKTKEIGIRKVLGASYGNITQLIIKDYMILLLIALLVAAPVSWWLFEDWLADFAYRITLSLNLFFTAFTIVLVISFATVLLRIFRIAKSNPVNLIRYE
ncbi:MAG: ABC transporter permease [Bacteroidota bacterium]